MEPEDYIGLFFFVVVFAVLFGVMIATAKRYKALAAELAPLGFVARSGFAFDRLEGRYKGREARLRHVKHGKSGPWTTFVHLAVASPAGFRFRADEEGLETAFLKAFGGEDVVLGDPAFDKAFRVRTNDPDRVTFALASDARQRLVSDQAASIRVEDDEVVLEVPGRLWAADALVRHFEFVETMAVRLEATR